MNETRCVCKRHKNRIYNPRHNQPNSYAVFAKSKTINTKQFFLQLACFGCIVSWLFIFLRYFRFGSKSLYWSVDRSVLFGNFMQFRYYYFFFTRFIRCQFVCRNQFFRWRLILNNHISVDRYKNR